MISLYNPENTNFDKNGDMAFPDVIAADANADLDGSDWKLTVTVPNDEEGRCLYIKQGAVFSVDTWVGKNQLYRIYDVVRNVSQTTAYANPIFMDSGNDVWLSSVTAAGDGLTALKTMLKDTRYHVISDIAAQGTSTYTNKNFMEAFNGSDEKSFVNVWGGEISYSNFTLRCMKRIGSDNGYRIKVGKNCTEIESDVDTKDVVTRIYPTGANTIEMSNHGYVDSPYIDAYPVVHCKTINFSDIHLQTAEDNNTDGIICTNQNELDSALRKACEEQFEAGVDKPTVNHKISMVDLSSMRGYEDIADLEKVSIGDTVTCKEEDLGIDVTARVISGVWDCIGGAWKSLEVGNFKYDYFSEMASVRQKVDSVISDKGNLIAGKLSGVIDGMMAGLRVQKSAAQKQDSRAILFEDTDPNSATYGAMCLGTKGLEIAEKRTSDGSDWDWTTALTAKGLIADVIIAGLLASKNYDPDNGKGFGFNLTNGDTQISNLYAMNVTSSGGMLTGTNWWGEVLTGEKTVAYTSHGIEMILPVSGKEARVTIDLRADKDGNNDGVLTLENTSDSGVKLKANIFGREAKTGRATWSDGTYLDFQNGILVGGHTKDGDL